MGGGGGGNFSDNSRTEYFMIHIHQIYSQNINFSYVSIISDISADELGQRKYIPTQFFQGGIDH